MVMPKLINPDIDSFYTATSEEGRLQLGLGPLEFERNKDLISRFLPKKGIIADIGGGPGIYAEWLAAIGHEVHLIDPVEKHIKQANKRSKQGKKPFRAILGEAQKLELPDNFADMVIMHGPLYHLQKKSERLGALAEAQRILKPGGVLLGFAINHSASTIVSFVNGAIHMPEIMQMCCEELTTGIHHPPKNIPGILTTSFFHRPKQLRAELEEGGFTYLNTFAVEGMIWLDNKYFETRSDEQKKAAVMELLKLTESDPELLTLSPHMMIAGRKN
ncbi:MAG: methyltransferase domain-containing protein [Bacteroidetes bacterium]|nr:methyltransferase domain-containing protein [Bacteroidota bacterium]